jgi:hypothetical protein
MKAVLVVAALAFWQPAFAGSDPERPAGGPDAANRTLLPPSAPVAGGIGGKSRAKLAEMMAFVRDGAGACGNVKVPAEWPSEVLGLYVDAGVNAPVEREIEVAQNQLDALKAKIGIAKWCLLYQADMLAADAIAKETGVKGLFR